MRLNIATRLWLPTLAITGLLLAVGTAVSLRTAGQIQAAGEALRSAESKLYDAAAWRGLTQANVVRVVASLIGNDPALDAAMKPEIAETAARITEIQQRVDAAAADPQERAALDRIAEARKAYIAARESAGQAKAGGDAAAAKSLLADKVQPAVTAYLAAQQAYVDLQRAQTAAVRAASGTERMRSVWAVLAVVAVVITLLMVSTMLTVPSAGRWPAWSRWPAASATATWMPRWTAAVTTRSARCSAPWQRCATRCAASWARCGSRPSRSRWPAAKWPVATPT